MGNGNGKGDAGMKLKTRIEPLREAWQGECTHEVKSEWYACASPLLTNNSFWCDTFATLLKRFWRKAEVNLKHYILTGVANCDKKRFWWIRLTRYATLLPTLQDSKIFAWVHADEEDVVFPKDIRSSPQIIAWSPPVSRRPELYWVRQRYAITQNKQAPSVFILQAEQKKISACGALGIWINAGLILCKKKSLLRRLFLEE